jgi:TusA-related sulfurtransferase
MEITPETKISRLLKEDPDMVDWITEIHPKFSKLSNPFLRKAIAPRVTVRDAARIANIPVENFLEKLSEKGFQTRMSAPGSTEKYVTECKIPHRYKIISINAAALLEQNADPFDPVNRALQNLQPGEAVEIKLDFIPVPLIDIFSRQGFNHCTLKKEDYYLTYFYKEKNTNSLWDKIKSFIKMKPSGKKSSESKKMHTAPPQEDFDRLKEKFKDKTREIDVRDLEMPQPMMTILEKLKTLPADHALFVHHKRIPQFLIPELEKRNYLWVSKKIHDDYVQMLIYKNKTND